MYLILVRRLKSLSCMYVSVLDCTSKTMLFPLCFLQALKSSKHFNNGENLPELLKELLQQYEQQEGGAAAQCSEGGTAMEVDAETGAAVPGAAAGGSGNNSAVAGAALQAFGVMMDFLEKNLLAEALLPHARYEGLGERVRG